MEQSHAAAENKEGANLRAAFYKTPLSIRPSSCSYTD